MMKTVKIIKLKVKSKDSFSFAKYWENTYINQDIEMLNELKNQKTKVKTNIYLWFIFLLLVFSSSYAQVIPIREVRKNNANGVPLLLNQTVTITGIVSVANQFGSSGPAFVFDNTGGVAIYSPIASQMTIGDSVTVTGTVIQFYGLTEITQATFIKHSSGRPVNPILMSIPEIDDIGADFVENEGTLIRLESIRIINASGNFAGNTNYTIQDTLGNTAQIRIDNNVSTIIGQPIPTGYFNLVGVISQYDPSSPYFNGYQVMPRNNNDMELPIQVIPIDSAIRDANNDGIPDLRGTNVTITGIVTAPSGIFSRTQTDIYVQDNTAGVNVFNFSYIPTALGDSVIVSGQVYFYRGKTEIANADITIVAHNRPLPAPLPITCAMMNQEPHEGRLVMLSGVRTNATTLSGNQNYYLIQGSDSCVMRIDADCEIPGLIMVNDTFTVIGIKSQYTTDTIPPVNTGYQLLPRFMTDFSKTLLDSYPLLPIAEVQRPGSDGFSSYYEGQYVKVKGRITGPAYIFTSGASKSLYIQDATNGINIYAPTSYIGTAHWLDSVGTEWYCFGKVTEYNGLTEIANGLMWLADSNRVIIEPRELPFNSPVTEGMESQLIKVSGPVISSPSSAGAGQNFTIKNGIPGITIRILNSTGISINQFQKNKNFQIVGIIGQYTTSSPFNTGYQVMPRFNSDIVDLTSSVTPSEVMRIDSIFPNPFSRRADDPLLQSCVIRINSPPDYKLYLEIFDMKGRLVKKLLANQPGGFYELRWDGTNEKYEVCPIGIYILNFKGITPQGKVEFIRKPIVIGTKL